MNSPDVVVIGADKISMVDPASLKPYVRNSRKHPPAQIRALAAAFLRFGFNSPILVNDNPQEIIKGHGCTEAALLLHMPLVPVVFLSHLSEPERHAFLIADNKLPEQSEWDEDILAAELLALAAEGFEDLQALGFDDSELIDLVGEELVQVDGYYRRRTAEDTGIGSEHTAPDKPAPNDVVVSLAGDVWFLGNHKFYCGASRNNEADHLIKAWQKLTGMKATNEAGKTFEEVLADRTKA